MLMRTAIKPFKYTDKQTPMSYVCDHCNAFGVRLYREYQTFADYTNLLCRKCACAHQKQLEPDLPSEHSIGWFVAAVPLESGDGYWGFTSVPDDGMTWWNDLPKVMP